VTHGRAAQRAATAPGVDANAAIPRAPQECGRVPAPAFLPHLSSALVAAPVTARFLARRLPPPRVHTHGAILVTCNRDDFFALRPEGEYPGIVILIRHRTRPAEIAGRQALLAGASAQGLANNVNFA
jgi:hypothetical protein